MIYYTDVPPIFFNNTQHYVDHAHLKSTACGIHYADEDWTIDHATEKGQHICWQCIIVGALHEDIRQLMKVFDAASAWAQDPDSGPRRGALAAAVQAYEDFMNEGIEFLDE